jgi:HNH endonuclease
MQELPHAPGEVISYLEMCQAWTASLQKGMNFHLRPECSLILMSRRPNAPYRDVVDENGRVLIYEGHDVSRTTENTNPKSVNQPRYSHGGKLTQNGLFENAALKAKSGEARAELVAVYEKIHAGIWAFNGFFLLTDAWTDSDGRRLVFKFRLELTESESASLSQTKLEPLHNRVIPSVVKLEVWQRDKGQCVLCGSKNNLHFDHDLPYSKGGSSLSADNIRLLCARHNLSKGAKIQ